MPRSRRWKQVVICLKVAVIKKGVLPEGLLQRPAQLSDVEQLLALSIEAGWNQTVADWRLLLDCAGVDTNISVWQDERPIASALAVNYGDRFAWICMVLVAAAWRSQGIATYLLRTLINNLIKQGIIAGLDATPAGRAVYQPLGFEEVYSVSRLQAHCKPILNNAMQIEGLIIQPLDSTDMAALSHWDTEIFGAKRRKILQTLQQRLPQCAHIARNGKGEIMGYILGRDGRTAAQLGPLVALDDYIARSLLVVALKELDNTEAVLIDIPDSQQNWLVFLQQLGFCKQRSFSRMLLKRQQPLDKPSNVFALTGPEFG